MIVLSLARFSVYWWMSDMDDDDNNDDKKVKGNSYNVSL